MRPTIPFFVLWAPLLLAVGSCAPREAGQKAANPIGKPGTSPCRCEQSAAQTAPAAAPCVPAESPCVPAEKATNDEEAASNIRRFTFDNSRIVELSSKETGRDYELLVGLPPSFGKEPDRRFPVLVFLDGQWDFGLLNALAGGLLFDQVIPEFLLVGITYGGKSPDYAALRAEDYVPTRAKDYRGKLLGGDASKFLAFIEDAVIPLVEREYRADPAHRILSGSSYGGLFTLFALFEKPELFHSYIALSPSVVWDDGWLFEREKEFRATHPQLERRVWLSVGDSEWPDYTRANLAFFAQFEKSGYKDVVLSTSLIEGERHAGNKPEAYNRAVRFAFAEWASKNPPKD